MFTLWHFDILACWHLTCWHFGIWTFWHLGMLAFWYLGILHRDGHVGIGVQSPRCPGRVIRGHANRCRSRFVTQSLSCGAGSAEFVMADLDSWSANWSWRLENGSSWRVWHFGMFTFWHFDILACWHLTCWHFGILTFWHLGMLAFWHLGILHRDGHVGIGVQSPRCPGRVIRGHAHRCRSRFVTQSLSCGAGSTEFVMADLDSWSANRSWRL